MATPNDANAVQESKNEIALVTRKVLVTFSHQICFLINGTPVFASAAICEYEDAADGVRSNDVRQFRVVGFPDGRPLPKTLVLHVTGWQTVAATVEL